MKKTQASSFDLLKGRASFSNEPLWYRLIVYLIQAAFFILLFYLIGKWSLPFLSQSILSNLPRKVSSLFKGRSP